MVKVHLMCSDPVGTTKAQTLYLLSKIKMLNMLRRFVEGEKNAKSFEEGDTRMHELP